MRHYAPDSPAAAGRVIALALMADGAIDPSETLALAHANVLEHVGLSERGFEEVVREVCEDLSQSGALSHQGDMTLDNATLRGVMRDITHPSLQRRILHAVVEIACADDRVADGERRLLMYAAASWKMDGKPGAARPGRRWPPRVHRLSSAGVMS